MGVVTALTLANKNGGFYECGRFYNLAKKRQVARAFLELQEELSPLEPTIRKVAKKAKVGWDYAKKVVMELAVHSGFIGHLVDPAVIHHAKTSSQGRYRCRLMP